MRVFTEVSDFTECFYALVWFLFFPTTCYFDSIYGDFIKSKEASLSPNKPFHVKQPWINDDIILTKLMCNTYLLENGMAQGDRLSMSNSIELRLPLIDYKFVETVIGLRKNNKDIVDFLIFV